MAESQSPQDGSFAAPRGGAHAGTRPFTGSYLDSPDVETGHVAHEVKVNARQLLTQTKGELSEQAQAQQQRVAEGLRSISDELSTMANSTEDGGVATDLVQQAVTPICHPQRPM
ncbi:hypothetical protein [Paenarthrobacter sp. A20]|uniref:hypothetical protein n=1 Tax=Paenarthrobacter sp. A20 TaxID=2817891 RepID=UPI00209D7213|nr:hypothetical protein [Paenarthrobacter sp. A20]MCP1411778.1 hypothetical protein [Paenarthrobacter sp. A20]